VLLQIVPTDNSCPLDREVSELDVGLSILGRSCLKFLQRGWTEADLHVEGAGRLSEHLGFHDTG
jgi:hypothetical protein